MSRIFLDDPLAGVGHHGHIERQFDPVGTRGLRLVRAFRRDLSASALRIIAAAIFSITFGCMNKSMKVSEVVALRPTAAA